MGTEPLTSAVFQILLALAGGERHGYAIMQEFQLGPGTLYGTIKRMLASGLIEEAGERTDPEVNEERRRYYRLTSNGKKAAQAEARRLEGLVRLAKSKSLLAKG